MTSTRTHLDAAPAAAATTRRPAWLPVVVALVFCAWPLAVWLGVRSHGVRTIAIALLGVMVPIVLLLPGRARSHGNARLAALPLLTIVGIAAAAVSDQVGWMLVGPVLVSSLLLGVFGATLRPGSIPMIERFARRYHRELTADKQRWCRLWTWIWCVFLLANGTAAALLAAFAPLSWWACYTSGVTYALMAILLLTEWALRRRRFYGA